MTAFVIIAVFFASFGLTNAVRKFALASDLLDTPNSRSSHVSPTPSGGGAAIVVAWTAGLLLLTFAGAVSTQLLLSILPPSIVIALVGFLDDKIGLSAGLRLLVQLVAAGWFVALNVGEIATGVPFVDDTPWLMMSACIVALVWLTNLFNFMDGIDGIAGAEAIFCSLAISAICYFLGAQEIAVIGAVLAAACAGFLLWNWPPARIFMGDTGSSCLGFVLGAMALSASGRTGIGVSIWTILLGVFLVDATVTLLRRLATGQPWYQAHRSHAYQILSRRWGAHGPVTAVVCLINVGWLLPLAVGACYLPQYEAMTALLALTPLVIAVFLLGAGAREKPARANSRDE